MPWWGWLIACIVGGYFALLALWVVAIRKLFGLYMDQFKDS